METVIKFRAWDKKTAKMSPDFHLFGEFTLMGAVHDWQHEEAFAIGVSDYEDSLGRLNDLEIMQFTGLLDRNNVEIYEGDIVTAYFHKERGSPNYAPIVFKNGAFLWHDKPLAFDEEDNSLIGTDWAIVVGNIHENPHLLQ